MSFGIFLAVLGAAFLHALWNALIKTGSSKVGGMVLLSFFEVPIGLAVVAISAPLNPAAIPWVLAAACTHFAYKLFLTFAYERGDLSRVYPIARGTAPMVVALVGAIWMIDPMSAPQYAGVFVLGFGILLMARGVFTGGEDRRMLPFALGSAAATATYTLIDGNGARVAGDAVAYIAWVFVADGFLFPLAMITVRGWGVIPRGRRDWTLGFLASAASYGAYAVSVWAMTKAPIALVAALRETSILFAVLIGWIWFNERMDRGKAVAAGLIIGGVVLTRL
jgi:drug/metabolite transporter (DMT)-like permease